MANDIGKHGREGEVDHWRQASIDTSRRLGDAVRQLCLGGLGAIWVLKIDTGDGFALTPSLKVATSLLVATLLIDVLHGVVFFGIAQNRLVTAKGHRGFEFLNVLDKPGLSVALLGLRAATLIASFALLLVYVLRML